MRKLFPFLLFLVLACPGCWQGKTDAQADVPRDTVPEPADTTGVIARVDAIYASVFDQFNYGGRLGDMDTCFSMRLKELWERIPENEMVYDACIWTNLQDFDLYVYRGADLKAHTADTALVEVCFQAFRDDTRTAQLRMVRETQDSVRAWYVDDIVFPGAGRSYSISSVAEACVPDSVVCFHWDSGTYNTHEEDNFIELRFLRGTLVDGYFWGTSDEFYDAREGFYPGYTVLRMHDISLLDDTLSFYLDSRGTQYLSGPVDLSVSSTAKALRQGAHPWAQSGYEAFFDSVRYRGLLGPDTLLLYKGKSSCPYREDHPFVRRSGEELQQLNRTCSYEAENRPQQAQPDTLAAGGMQ